MAKSKTVDPIFAEYARTAPRLDLATYIAYASRHAHEYNPPTRAIMSAMVSLENDLARVAIGAKVPGVPRTPAGQKALVWQVIDRFKGSIQDWYGKGELFTREELAGFEAERVALRAAPPSTTVVTDVAAIYADTADTPEPPTDADARDPHDDDPPIQESGRFRIEFPITGTVIQEPVTKPMIARTALVDDYPAIETEGDTDATF